MFCLQIYFYITRDHSPGNIQNFISQCFTQRGRRQIKCHRHPYMKQEQLFQSSIQSQKCYLSIQTNTKCGPPLPEQLSNKCWIWFQTNINYQFSQISIIISDKYQLSFQTNMKWGPSLQGQLSQASTRVHRPWQPGLITFLNLATKNVIMPYISHHIPSWKCYDDPGWVNFSTWKCNISSGL